MSLLSRLRAPGRQRSAHEASGSQVSAEVNQLVEAYEEALRLIDSTEEWNPERTKQLVAIVQPVAPSFTEDKVGELLGPVVISSVGKGADPNTEVKLFLKQQIENALEEFKRLSTELQ